MSQQSSTTPASTTRDPFNVMRTVVGIIAGGLFLCVGLLSIGWSIWGPDTIRISDKIIRAQAEKQTERTIEIKRGVLGRIIKTISPKEIQFSLGENRIEARVRIEGVGAFDKNYAAVVSGRGVPRLRGSDVFIDVEKGSLKIEEFIFDGKPIEMTIKAVADRYLTNPGWRLLVQDNAKRGENLSKSFIEALGEDYLGRKRVYEIKGWKGTLAKWSVQEVKVEPGAMVVKFSLGSLLWNIMTWVIGAAFIVGVVLIFAMGGFAF